jgi:peroxiredoxin
MPSAAIYDPGALEMHDPTQLPVDLPVPSDDGEAEHLTALRVPALSLPATDGSSMRVDVAPTGFERLVLYAYPLTGIPGAEPPPGWDAIPGARGCTPEACGFRDHVADLASVGAIVAGVSTQSTAYQHEATVRLHLPFPLLSDVELRLTRALRLPTFTVEVRPEHDGGGRKTLLRRLTLVVRDGLIEHVFYPVFPPDRHAEEVLVWLRGSQVPIGP